MYIRGLRGLGDDGADYGEFGVTDLPVAEPSAPDISVDFPSMPTPSGSNIPYQDIFGKVLQSGTDIAKAYLTKQTAQAQAQQAQAQRYALPPALVPRAGFSPFPAISGGAGGTLGNVITLGAIGAGIFFLVKAIR